ncbi:2933_t:CDS:2 [Entrophospora sp. SA101]|nr:2933_t:CDS:2 [Entrophospora sp. SA101]CAJ0828431.1 4640_t:CDS:2 [Entrophospora sp. SA101]
MEDLKVSGYNDTLESRIEELKEKIMEAVEMMHSQGWIHGDMRLKNIMFKQDNNNEWKETSLALECQAWW